MNRLLVFGLGYTGQAVARAAGAAGWVVEGTSRDGHPPTIPFTEAEAAIAAATHVLVTAPPRQPLPTEPVSRGQPERGAAGDPRVRPEDAGADAAAPGPADADPVLALYADALRAAPNLRWIGYLSSTVVYGNRDGGWVTEASPPAPTQDRGRRRLAAERAWEDLADRCPVDIIRLAGIYGPGRSAFDDLRAGRARRTIKPGHCFGRIHRDDIARAVVAAMAQDRPPGRRVLNLTDDEPSESATVMAEAAALLNVPPPPEISFEDALLAMSPMARSFWAENRKVSCVATKAALGIEWLYPTYREGLRAILAEESGHRPP